jgi:hypothetical protein
MAARLLTQQAEAELAAEEGGAPASKKARKAAQAISTSNPLADDRFRALFEEEDFAVDEASKEYQLLHPNADKVGFDAGRGEREGGTGGTWAFDCGLPCGGEHLCSEASFILSDRLHRSGATSGCWRSTLRSWRRTRGAAARRRRRAAGARGTRRRGPAAAARAATAAGDEGGAAAAAA